MKSRHFPGPRARSVSARGAQNVVRRREERQGGVRRSGHLLLGERAHQDQGLVQLVQGEDPSAARGVDHQAEEHDPPATAIPEQVLLEHDGGAAPIQGAHGEGEDAARGCSRLALLPGKGTS